MRATGKLLTYGLGLASIILFLIGLATKDVGMLSLAAFSAWGMAIFGALSKENRNLIYIFFLITFFIFLLSRVMVRWLRFSEVYQPFSYEVMVMIYGCITISLFGLTSGDALSHVRFGFGKKSYENVFEDEAHLARNDKINHALIRQLSGIATVVSGFATLLSVIERIAFWRITGYGGDLRTSFSSTLPEIVLRMSYVYVMLFCIYLATLPEKRKCMPIIGQYVFVNALRMFYGSRADFVVGLMFIFVYFTIRDRLNKSNNEVNETVWIGRGEKLFTLISIPLLIILIVFVGNYRRHVGFEFNSFFNTLGDFFESQGTSINVIGYTNVYKDQFTQPKFLYLFDRTYEFLTTNPIAQIVTHRHSYSANTIERARYGTSLGMTLYYNINQASYLAGNGSGTSYVAEAWLGYGYVGLFIANFFLQRIMNYLNKHRFDSFIPSVVVLIYLQSLFFMPRGGFDSFVDDFASITHIFTIFLLWMTYKLIEQKKAR